MFRARTNGDAIKVTVQSHRFYTLRRLSQRSSTPLKYAVIAVVNAAQVRDTSTRSQRWSTPLKYVVTVRIKLRRERGVELPGARVRQVRQGRAPSTRESPYMMDTATQPRIKVAVRTIRDAAYHQDDVASSSYQDKPSPTAWSRSPSRKHSPQSFSP